MEQFSVTPEKKLMSPDQEMEFLRERLRQLEAQADAGTYELTHERPEEEITRSYAKTPPESVLAKGNEMLKPEIDAVVLDLAPEEHDSVMNELLAIVRSKGVRNALSVVEKLHDAHIEDDFHRFLAEYLKSGYPAPGIKEGEPLWKALHMSLFEITLPFTAQEMQEQHRPLKELISSMEQFYAGALSTTFEEGARKNHFTLELAVESNKENVVLYVSVPVEKISLFQKHLLSIFPQARLEILKNDYNIFVPDGAVAGSVCSYAKHDAFPIKTHDAFDYDPLNILFSAFGKLLKTGEGAALQVLIRPSQSEYVDKFKKAIEKMSKGTPVKEALTEKSLIAKFGKEINEMFFMSKEKKDKKKEKERERPPDEIAIEQIKQKISYPIVEVNARLLASATSQIRADAILSDMEASFSQFNEPVGNSFEFTRIKKKEIKPLIKNFIFRLFSSKDRMLMNLREVATIIHLPSVGSDASRELKRSKASVAPAPLDLPETGVLIGHNIYGGTETPVRIGNTDRMRHFYCIGQTGVGKTTLLKNMIIQDIENGEGVCMIDPHGSDLLDVLSHVPSDRWDDVIYFDPAYTKRPMGLNMLEYDPRYPEQKTFVVNEMMSIFNKLFDMKATGGPMFEQYFRNATMLVIEDPETGNTLFDVSRVMSEEAFRELKLSRCKNPVVVQFWREVAEKAGGEAKLANIVPYITSKFDVFLSNDIMRPIIIQKESAFNFRKIMDERKILLVNLSKGRLGDINANLIGLIIVGKILMAALSRVDMLGMKDIPNFFLYIDEFQNITTDSIATILSEARKYKLGLNIYHQYIKQLEEKIRDAVFGNVGTICSYRVGTEDAEFLEKQFEPVFTANDLMNVDNFNMFIKTLVNNKTARPFSVRVPNTDKGNPEVLETLKELSYVRFGRPREDIEEEVARKYKI